MPRCSVDTCKNDSKRSSFQNNKVTFHIFPKDPNRRQLWIQATGKHESWVPKPQNTICSEHFEKLCYNHHAQNRRILDDSAVPTLKIYNASVPLEPVSETGVTQHCCMPHCKSYEQEEFQFYRFPANQNIRRRWEEAVGKSSSEHMRVCSKHFTPSDIVSVPDAKGFTRCLKSNAVPVTETPTDTSLLLSQFNVQLYTAATNAAAIPTGITKEFLQPASNKEIDSREKVKQAVCMKCKTEVDPTETAKIGEESVKAVIANVYHFFEQDYYELKKKYRKLDFKIQGGPRLMLKQLVNHKRRTAEATGVYQTDLSKILKEEKERKITHNGPPKKRHKVDQDDREKNSSLTSHEEDNSPGESDDNDAQLEYQTDESDFGPETLVVKMEASDEEIDIQRAFGEAATIEERIKTEPIVN